ncbi:excinuclease Cho [Mixta tenebrionis]|uniref:Excinuclease cho n=1 Tax=Mixta tenebrionis TaxID=2562439 RepID=A0A506VEQ3_9GAMM|nr:MULTISPECIES: excinuclease Cho [Mixta]QHM75680.1 Excinuclease cho [Mixta theicola]TPW44287.1 excinuclease Cho [Mixta tenebrionis]
MVRRAASHRLQFEPAAIYEYPEHLRAFLADIPNLPGVYIFHGDSEVMPLYIGKSISLRTRVMSHFRTPEEAKMLRLTRRISWITTAGELGALLLEAQMIKNQQPLFNKRLRRNRQLCSLQWDGINRPEVVYARDLDFSASPNLFGLYASRRAALETLRKIADEHQLCYGLLGLEGHSRNRACFRASLGRCAGACCGKEPVSAHHARLLQALEKVRVICWPWPGAVALVEEGPQETQMHIIHNWFYLGSVSRLDEAKGLTSPPQGFDNDGYKYLCRPLLSGKYPIIPL